MLLVQPLGLPVGSKEEKEHRSDGGTSRPLLTTLWRYLELSPTVIVGATSGHPPRPGPDFSDRNRLRYVVRSRPWGTSSTRQ